MLWNYLGEWLLLVLHVHVVVGGVHVVHVVVIDVVDVEVNWLNHENQI